MELVRLDRTAVALLEGFRAGFGDEATLPPEDRHIVADNPRQVGVIWAAELMELSVANDMFHVDSVHSPVYMKEGDDPVEQRFSLTNVGGLLEYTRQEVSFQIDCDGPNITAPGLDFSGWEAHIIGDKRELLEFDREKFEKALRENPETMGRLRDLMIEYYPELAELLKLD